MKILFWCETFWPLIGGVQVLGARLADALSKRGFELLIVARRDNDDLPEYNRYGDIPIHRFPFLRGLHSRDLTHVLELRDQLSRLTHSFQPDLVHVFQSGPGVYFHVISPESHGRPLAMTLHETYASRFLQPDSLRGRLMRSASWIAACSASVLDATRQQVPDISARSSVVRNSLEMPTLAPAPLCFDPPRLLCIGRVVPDKGFDVALAAVKLLANRFPHAELIIAGDGPDRGPLEQQALSLGLRTVEFRGWVDPEEVPALLNSCTLVLMPSRVEPFGLVALQAAQMARPIVASRVGGLPEIVIQGETGWLVEKGDSNALASAVAFLLEHPELAVRMGQAARRRALRVFPWDNYVEAYEHLYRTLQERPNV